MNVCARMPDVELQAEVNVNDEEDNSITANSIVTVKVKLQRKPLEESFGLELNEGEEKEQEEKQEEKPTQTKSWQKVVKKKKKSTKPRKSGLYKQTNFLEFFH